MMASSTAAKPDWLQSTSPGADHGEVFAPVARHASMRALLMMAVV
jgi:hypothetical protein